MIPRIQPLKLQVTIAIISFIQGNLIEYQLCARCHGRILYTLFNLIQQQFGKMRKMKRREFELSTRGHKAGDAFNSKPRFLHVSPPTSHNSPLSIWRQSLFLPRQWIPNLSPPLLSYVLIKVPRFWKSLIAWLNLPRNNVSLLLERHLDLSTRAFAQHEIIRFITESIVIPA